MLETLPGRRPANRFAREQNPETRDETRIDFRSNTDPQPRSLIRDGDYRIRNRSSEMRLLNAETAAETYKIKRSIICLTTLKQQA